MSELPEVITQYHASHDFRDTNSALTTFARDAVVKDEGHEYRGREEIRDWLSRASVEFTYTRTLIEADEIDSNTWVVVNHLEGDFPGGEVDLRYRFVVTDGYIRELDISA
jgi:SnoaL-like domain